MISHIGFRYGLTAGEIAVAWTLSNPAVTAAIVGVRHPHQVAEIIGAAGFRLSLNELNEIAHAQMAEAGELSVWM